MELVIKRSQWLRGEGSYKSYLLREADGKMCCLGFLSLAAGLSRDQILEMDTVCMVKDKKGCDIPESLRWLIHAYDSSSVRWSSHDATHLMEMNDNEDVDDVTRERYIIDTFAKHGVEVRFED